MFDVLLRPTSKDVTDEREAAQYAAAPKQTTRAEAQPSIKVFVSYARADLAFADQLVAALEAHDIEVRIDRRNLPFAREWQEELVEMVRWADTVLFIISPDAIGSKWCKWELAQVVKHQKRLGPIVFRRVENDRIPEELSKLQYISFAPPSDFDTAIERLVEQLGTDIDWVRQHTDLAEAARKWKAAEQKKARDFLLRGATLSAAKSWLDARPPAAPEPTTEQLELITASERASSRMRRIFTAGAIAVAVIASALAGLAYWQRNQALENQSRFLADQSEQQTGRGNASNGILLALEALPKFIAERPFLAEAEAALYRAVWEHRELAVLCGHDDKVLSAAFSPDGSKVVTASSDRTARVWDAASGKELKVLEGHKDEVRSGAFSPDGAKVVTASNDRTARLWDVVTGQALPVLGGHEDWVWSAAFSPDGTKVVTALGDGTARVWDAASGRELEVLKGHEDLVLWAAFSPDGAKVVTASSDDTARLWNAASGEELEVLEGHEDWVPSATFSTDGTKVLTVSADRTARVWDVATGQALAVLRGHNDEVFSAAFSPEGTKVVTASLDSTARIWDVASGEELKVLRGHDDQVVKVAFGPDGVNVVTASTDDTARLWGLESGQALAVLRGHEDDVLSAAFSSDGAKVVTASADRTARIWNAASGKEQKVLRGHADDALSAAFSSDGAKVVTASADLQPGSGTR